MPAPVAPLALIVTTDGSTLSATVATWHTAEDDPDESPERLNSHTAAITSRVTTMIATRISPYGDLC